MRKAERGRIAGLGEDEFIRQMNLYLHPSSPVRRHEVLQGRAPQLEQLRRALASTGRHVFVYGLRGVGKTSLAQTAAYLHQSSDADPVLVSCTPDSTFAEVIQSAARQLFGQTPGFARSVKTKRISATLGSLGAESVAEIEQGRLPLPAGVDEAVDLLRWCGELHSKKPLVVVDEFDRLKVGEKSKFGDFLKQMGDQMVDVKLIFCGIGESLDELLGQHESCFRYLAGIRLERLSFDACMDIIKLAAERIGFEISQDYLIRAAWIGDGFPHYSHLVGSKLCWQVYEDPGPQAAVRAHHFTAAIQEAVQDVEPHLKRIYDLATQKYTNDYQYVLWAAADRPDIDRRSVDIWESYQRIVQSLKIEAIDRKQFNTRMSALKTERHGCVLVGNRSGWYRFQEPMLRGYCRLKAEQSGVQLDRDHFLSPPRRSIDEL